MKEQERPQMAIDLSHNDIHNVVCWNFSSDWNFVHWEIKSTLCWQTSRRRLTVYMTNQLTHLNFPVSYYWL